MKEINVEIDYTPLMDAIEKYGLSENQIFKQWGIHRKIFYNLKIGKGITVDTWARLSVMLDKDINQLVNIKYTIIERSE